MREKTMKPDYYKLDKDHNIIGAIDIHDWGKFFESSDRIVKQENLPNGLRISTVFLGIDHNFSDEGPPVLFETMIFGMEDEVQQRYSTWDEAVKGHEELKKEYENYVVKQLEEERTKFEGTENN